MKIFAFSTILISLITSLFWFTSLDIYVASIFYHPELDNPWPDGNNMLLRFFYSLIPFISTIILFGSLIIIIVSTFFKKALPLKTPAIYLLICLLIGPGLIVNAILKDNWGRERPENIVELGGTYSYTPPAKVNVYGDGKSFPSGHSSVGFFLISFYFLLKNRSKRLANIALASTLVIGVGTGIARMAAGGHFLSDVIWSAFITFATSYIVYLLMKSRLEQRQDLG